MSSMIRRFCTLLLALPLVAVADPVTVTTHSTGVQNTNDASLAGANSMLNVLGLDPLVPGAPVPYDLTLTSTFDTNSMPSPESFWAYANGNVVIDFHIGAQTYHYAGAANSSAHLAGQSANVEEYGHTISLEAPNYFYGFAHEMTGPTGSMGQFNPLAPLDVDESKLTNYSAHIGFSLKTEPISFSMDPTTSTMTVHVAAVPEPASYALLAAGLAMFALPRLRARRARRRYANGTC
jgi:hypothetical protein